MQSDDEDEEGDYSQMQYPQHCKDIEKDRSSSERKRYDKQEYHRKIEADLKDRFSVLIAGEVGSDPED